jgi:predicted nucleic-acid-binding protein
MFAIDTNILVRYLTGGHPEQSANARKLVDENAVYVSRTVMLESEWVLRSVYDCSAPEIARALRKFAGLEQVLVESPADIATALDRTEAGVDFADSLHLSSLGTCEALVTLDRKFIKAAQASGVAQVREP